MLFTFLTVTGLSSFCSLNLYFAIIFLSINIPVIPLSKSALTVMPSCIFIFSTPIFNYTSFNILNILLISLWPISSVAVLLRTSVCILFCCIFFSMGYATTFQFYHGFFFPVLHSGHRIPFFSYSNTFSFIISFLLYFIHYTLVISSLFASSSFQFHAFWHRLYHMFLTCLLRRNSCLWFS